jgi:hypothetical protein
MKWYRIINPAGLRPELGEIIRSRNITHMYLGDGRFFVKISDSTLLYLQIRLPVDVVITTILDPGVQLAVEQTYLSMYAQGPGVNS